MLAPEIIPGDGLFELIVELVKKYKPNTILEIGSGSGYGSTQAFIKGIIQAEIDGTCQLICIEPDRERFIDLKEQETAFPFMKCILGCSSPVSAYMSDYDIEKFMKEHGYRFNIKQYSVETVKRWKRNEIDKIEKLELESDTPIINQGAYCNAVLNAVGGMDLIKDWNECNDFNFDMVLIDGSAFSGDNDYNLVYGAKIIIMDDTLDIKCFNAARRSMSDPMYMLIHEDRNYRNGYAVFERMN